MVVAPFVNLPIAIIVNAIANFCGTGIYRCITIITVTTGNNIAKRLIAPFEEFVIRTIAISICIQIVNGGVASRWTGILPTLLPDCPHLVQYRTVALRY